LPFPPARLQLQRRTKRTHVSHFALPGGAGQHRR
jgi:hypothetical protein